MTLPLGRHLLNRYRLEKVIGRGGTATVYRGFDPLMERIVAIKTFPPHILGTETTKEQFTTEVRVIGQLEHPHILPIYDCGHEGDTPFIVMRFADNGSLGNELSKGLPTLDRVAEVFDQVARGLDYAHQRGMVHRDIKPQNVLVEASGDLYIGDFSLAILMSAKQESESQQTTTGTAYYMSPEQCRGLPVDARSDIYSLGAMLYEMTTGKRPYEGANWAEIVVKVLQDDPPLPRSLNPHIPDGVQDVILKAMERESRERFTSAREMARALNDSI
jgi:serine/threonine-protein kinase